MNSEELYSFLSVIRRERPDNITRIFFVKKASRLQSFEPQVSCDIQKRILDSILPYILNMLCSAQMVDYNPIGCADGELELLEKGKVSAVGSFIESVTGDRLNKEMSNLNIGRISFYCVKIEYSGHEIYLFRQFTKMKRLRSGFVARIFNDELVALENDFLGIDEITDIILSEEQLFIFNHISLERIFDYRDEYLKKTNEAMGALLGQDVISNLEQFSEDCRRDVRIMKRFTNLMSRDRLPLFFENYEKVQGIVNELGLDIEFDDDGKLIYREKSQLFHIINLMSDAYFRTLLSERKGIAKLEEDIAQE